MNLANPDSVDAVLQLADDGIVFGYDGVDGAGLVVDWSTSHYSNPVGEYVMVRSLLLGCMLK